MGRRCRSDSPERREFASESITQLCPLTHDDDHSVVAAVRLARPHFGPL